MVLGLLFPTSGRIAVFGKRPTDVRSKARIGFLPEDSYLYPFLDARETLDYYGRLFHLPRRQRLNRIDMLLEMVGLKSVAYRRIGEYSKGMQRRIGLAQALINDPDLLILDEPTGGMDPIGSRDFKELIGTLSQRGKTVLLSSHLLADVEEVCDRVCVLYGGRQRALGEVEELLAKEEHTQIVTDRLDEDVLAKLRQLLSETGHEVQVSTPHDKLETLFLRIVREAQDKRLATGGALAGGKVAEFLRTGEQGEAGREVIQQLVESARQEPQEPEKPQAGGKAALSETKPAPAKEVIEDLVSGRADEQESGGETEKEETAEQDRKSKKPADRSVIDNLIDDNHGKDE
jgi:ABC-2 type transport system ATP-binding protein